MNPSKSALKAPALHSPLTVLPGGREAEWIVKPGKPVLLSPEIGSLEASRILGLSQRRIRAMAREGKLPKGSWNRPGGKKGKYLFNRVAIVARKMEGCL